MFENVLLFSLNIYIFQEIQNRKLKEKQNGRVERRQIHLYGILTLVAIIAILLASQTQSDIPLEKLKDKYTNEASKFIEVDGPARALQRRRPGLSAGSDSRLRSIARYLGRLGDAKALLLLD